MKTEIITHYPLELTGLPIMALQQYFSAQKDIKNAYLFGSFSRNEQNEESDVDILVELSYENNRFNYYTFMDIQADLSMICGRKVDLLSTQGVSPFMMPYIDKDKLLIYEK